MKLVFLVLALASLAAAQGYANCAAATLQGASNVATCIATPSCFSCPPCPAFSQTMCWNRAAQPTVGTCAMLNRSALCTGQCANGYNCGGVFTSCSGVTTYGPAGTTPSPPAKSDASVDVSLAALCALALLLYACLA